MPSNIAFLILAVLLVASHEASAFHVFWAQPRTFVCSRSTFPFKNGFVGNKQRTTGLGLFGSSDSKDRKKEAIQETNKNTKVAVDDTVGFVKDRFNDAKEAEENAVDSVQGNSKNFRQSARNSLDDARNAKEDAKDWTSEKGEDVKGAADDARKGAMRNIGVTPEEDKSIFRKAKEKVVDPAIDAVGTAASKTKSVVKGAVSYVKEKAIDAKDAVKDAVSNDDN